MEHGAMGARARAIARRGDRVAPDRQTGADLASWLRAASSSRRGGFSSFTLKRGEPAPACLTAAGTVAHEEIPYEDECRPGRSRSSAGRRRLRGHGVGESQDEFARHG
jgi:hypothetical protein